MFSRANTNTRRPMRFATAGLGCSEGRVLDFSVTGLRLVRFRAWRPGESREVILTSDQASPVTVCATAIWCRRSGPFRYTIGLGFTDLTRRDEIQLARLAALHAQPEATEPAAPRKAA